MGMIFQMSPDPVSRLTNALALQRVRRIDVVDDHHRPGVAETLHVHEVLQGELDLVHAVDVAEVDGLHGRGVGETEEVVAGGEAHRMVGG